MCSKPASPGYLRQPDKPSKTQSAASSDTQSGQPRRTIAPQNLVVPNDLPIAAHADDIIAKLRDHQVLVVSGETGSGKSTQLPKLCLAAGLGDRGRIGHTQPRRLAARSIASRLAEETKMTLGQEVGFKIRFGDQTSSSTLIKLMTDGILLAETQSDPDLLAYDAIIIDEAHERSLNIDFLLGYLRRLIERRPDLRVIITSATIDAERFAQHFDDAPILSVEGRGYPVEIRYLPWEADLDDDESDNRKPYDLAKHVIAGLQQLRREGDGDVLIFLPTERDIRNVSHRVSGHFKRVGLSQRVDCLPLYARLPQSQQTAIFRPTGSRQRLIFATNVAESSLTVPRIRYVIDSGTARISRYSPRTKVQRLPIEPVSRASARQRAGRCGRIGPGICLRLFSEEDFESRPEFTTPEIRRTNLASVILQSKTLRLGPLEQFPLLDVPRPESIREGLQTLKELAAIDDDQELTSLGWRLGRLPVDPRVGRILLAAIDEDALPEILPIAAAMEIQDPRERPPDKQQAADEAQAQFIDPDSDFLSLLRLWRWFEQLRSDASRNQITRTLRRHFLSPNRMREWTDVFRQLKQIATGMQRTSQRGRSSLRPIRYADVDDTPQTANQTNPSKRSGKRTGGAAIQPIVNKERYAAIHQSLLSGLLSGVAMAGDKNEYQGVRGIKLFLWPGSGVFESKPKWIVAAELVETAKTYARVVARVQPSWIEAVGSHMLKCSYRDPHWSRKSGAALVHQRLSLFGLPVVASRRVPLPPIDLAAARDLLIQHGLVQQELTTSARCIRHNRQLMESLERLAAKTRRRDLVIDDYTIQAFYQDRIPCWVGDRARLEKFDRQCVTPPWCNQLKSDADISAWLANTPDSSSEPGPLMEAKTAASSDSTEIAPTPYMRPNDIVNATDDAISAEAFPDELLAGGSQLPLTYSFAPGTDHDGVQVTIHQSVLTHVSDDALGWLVPGLLSGKILALIKSLPKRLRRNLVPAAETTAKVLAEIEPLRGEAPFLPTLCDALTRHAETKISETDFQFDKVETHNQFLVRVVDDSGQTVATDRGVDALKSSIAMPPAELSESRDQAEEQWSRTGMKSWDLDALPSQVTRRRGGVQVAQFPGLIDGGESVDTALFADLQTAEASIRLGCMRLFSIACKKDLRPQVRHLPGLAESKIKLASIIPPDVIESTLMDLLARVALVENQPLVRDQESFQQRLDNAPTQIGVATQEVAKWLSAWTEQVHQMRLIRESLRGSHSRPTQESVTQQLDWLLADGFLSWTPWQWLQHYPRYFQAITYRLDKLQSGGISRDAASEAIIVDLWQRWLTTLPPENANAADQAHCEFRWMMEELRVSQLAQPLGTSMKISPQRCSKWLDHAT